MSEIKRDMSFFMKGSEQNLPEETHIISKRFKENEGKVIPFVIRAITTTKQEEIQKECTSMKGKRGNKQEYFDKDRFAAKLAVECTVYPNFKDKELLEHFDCIDPVKLVKKMLYIPGEYSDLMDKILTINGYDDDFESLVNDAKN